MKILVVNAGSSSLKYQLIDMKDESVIAKGNCERIGIDGKITHKTFDGREYVEECSFPTHTEAFEKLVEVMTKGDAAVIKDMSEIGAVGHRIVQGAEVFTKTTIVTDEVIDQIDGLADLAPVHNHAHALALRACKKVIPETTPQVVVFDTAFHQTMPPKAYMFGMPYECYEQFHVRKYGFHGTSHRFVSMKYGEVTGKSLEGLNIVSCHLGNGSSITAIKDGKSVDTSMGFTPLDGIIMGTRSGSVDPSAVEFVQNKLGFTPAQMSDYLNKKSGFLGLSGQFSDNRDITSAAQQGDKRSQLGGLTTSSTAIFVPFTTCELFQEGEALYYGLNALSNNLIMANRKTLKNPNGLFLGTPGSGKSFSAKREIVNVFLLTEDDIIIADPENEYGPLVQQFGSQGQVIDISPTSTNYINPMDINLDYSDDENPITLKSDFILSLCDLIIGGKEGLSPIERTIIDRCTRLVYREYLQDPCPENMPILGDLYELLLKQSEPEAQNIATALEIYVNGSLNVFNHRSNIQMDKHRVLCFQLKSLGKALKEIGLLIMQDAVWNRVTANRSKHKTTWFYIDEFHLLLKGQTGSFSVEIWKRFRKWGGIPSGLTQNVKDLLASREIENIFENSDFIYMLNQAQGDRQILAKQLGISPHQLSYVTHSGPGEGLLFFGNVIIPFVDHFPKDTLLYSVLTTRPDEVAGTKA